VTAAYTPLPPNSDGQAMIILGAIDGSIVAFDPAKEEFLNFGQKSHIMNGQIGTISVKNNFVVMSSSTGMIVKYPIQGNKILPPEDPSQIISMKAESAITSLVMDDLNVEGILGTSMGNIFYLNLEAQQLIRLVSRAAPGLDNIGIVKFDPTNQAVFLSSSGKESGEVKLFTTGTLD